MGSTAYSPRLTGYFLATKVVQHAIGLLIATFVFSLAALSLADVGAVAMCPMYLSYWYSCLCRAGNSTWGLTASENPVNDSAKGE